MGTAVANVLCGPVAVAFILVALVLVLAGHDFAFDFRNAYWSAGHRVLLGRSPYAWTARQFHEDLAFVYPAASALVFAPLALLPVGFASVLFTFVCIAMAPATLWILGVRDWRVYGVTLLWMPVYAAWYTANETMFLVFGAACLWRLRDRALPVGLLLAAMISMKLMLWPLALWLLATRRWRASAYALAAGLVINLIAWSVIGFDQIGPFLHASRIDVSGAWRAGYGVEALASRLGLSRGSGYLLMLLLSAGLLAVLTRAAFVKRHDLQALVVAIAIALCSSPLLWSHYLALLIVPMAIVFPRLNPLWALPALMWASPWGFTIHGWQVALLWCGAVAMLIATGRASAGRAAQRPPEMTVGMVTA